MIYTVLVIMKVIHVCCCYGNVLLLAHQLYKQGHYVECLSRLRPLYQPTAKNTVSGCIKLLFANCHAKLVCVSIITIDPFFIHSSIHLSINLPFIHPFIRGGTSYHYIIIKHVWTYLH